MKTAIVAVNFNGKNDSIELIKSLNQMSDKNFFVIVVDNGSIDGSVPAIKKAFPNTVIVANKENTGLARASNQGIVLAMKKGVENILVMNNDVVVKKDFLTQLLACSKRHPDAAVVMPKIMYYSDRKTIWCAGLSGRGLLEPSSIGLNQADSPSFDEEKEIFSAHCITLFKASALKKIGLIHDEYFLMHSETELGIRARKNGFKVFYAPKAVAYHKVSRSFEHLGAIRPIAVYYTIRNWLITLRRDYGLHYFIAAWLLEAIVLSWFREIKFIAGGQTGAIKAYWLGLLDALRDKMPLRYVRK